MGRFVVMAEVQNPEGGESEQIPLLADTGAVLSLVRGSILDGLGIPRERQVRSILADGVTPMIRDMGHAFIRVSVWEGTQREEIEERVRVLFGTEEDSMVLGVSFMEQILTIPNILTGRLISAEPLFR